jgi:hypothetical protein
MNRNRRIFIIVFFVFLAGVLLVLFDMASRTTAPWNRKKQITRAIPVTGNSQSDTIRLDTTTVR